MKNSIYIALFTSIFLFSCSAVQKTESEEVDENKSVYVFDDVSVSDDTSVENKIEEVKEDLPEPVTKIEMYLVQVGAFSTLDKAKTFVTKIVDKVNHELNIHLRESDNLYVVQLPPFRTYDEAQKVKNELKLIPKLEGTFVVVPNSK